MGDEQTEMKIVVKLTQLYEITPFDFAIYFFNWHSYSETLEAFPYR